MRFITYIIGCIFLTSIISLYAAQNNQMPNKSSSEEKVEYTHAVQPAVQILSRKTHSISFINGFKLINSNAQYYSYQNSLDEYLLKGKNTLELYVKPLESEDDDESYVNIMINAFGGSEDASSVSSYESHDSEAEMLAKDAFPSDPEKGETIVRLDFKYNHKTHKENIDSSISKSRFNIALAEEGLVKSDNPNGNYLFDSMHVSQVSHGYYKIEIEFYLYEDRPYTAIYTADDIPVSSADNDDAIFAAPDKAIAKGLYEETRKAYEIIKANDFDAWYEYIKPVTMRFRSNPVFKEGVTPGAVADVAIEAAINQMSCELDEFHDTGDEALEAIVLFQNKLAVIKNAIYYRSTKFNYSLSIDVYYAYEDHKWVVSYIEVD